MKNKMALLLVIVFLISPLLNGVYAATEYKDGTYDVKAEFFSKSGAQTHLTKFIKYAKVTMEDDKAKLMIQFRPLKSPSGRIFLGEFGIEGYNGYVKSKYATFDKYNDPANGTDAHMKGKKYVRISVYDIDIHKDQYPCKLYVPYSATNPIKVDLKLDFSTVLKTSSNRTPKLVGQVQNNLPDLSAEVQIPEHAFDLDRDMLANQEEQNQDDDQSQPEENGNSGGSEEGENNQDSTVDESSQGDENGAVESDGGSEQSQSDSSDNSSSDDQNTDSQGSGQTANESSDDVETSEDGSNGKGEEADAKDSELDEENTDAEPEDENVDDAKAKDEEGEEGAESSDIGGEEEKASSGSSIVYIILAVAVVLAIVLSYFMGKNKSLSEKVDLLETDAKKLAEDNGADVSGEAGSERAGKPEGEEKTESEEKIEKEE